MDMMTLNYQINELIHQIDNLTPGTEKFIEKCIELNKLELKYNTKLLKKESRRVIFKKEIIQLKKGEDE